MIIFKYLNKQLLLNTLAITVVLLLVLMSSRLIKYLVQAADGTLAKDYLWSLIAFRLPDTLQMLLPVCLLLAILLVYGRMHIDNEMTVFYASGISIKTLTFYSMTSVILIAFIVGALSFFFGPWGLKKVDQLFADNANRTAFDALEAGRFESLGPSGQVVYAETLSRDRKVMGGVFIEQDKQEASPSGSRQQTQLVAEYGHFEVRQQSQSKFLVLQNGYRYDGSPGALDYRVTKFDSYAVKIDPPAVEEDVGSARGKLTSELIGSESLSDIAELQWRISLPLLVPIVALFGIPLSRVNPRQGRYMFLLPAILFYLAYLVLLSNMKNAIEAGRIDPWLGLWWVHLVFLLLALMLFSNSHRKIMRLFKPHVASRK